MLNAEASVLHGAISLPHRQQVVNLNTDRVKRFLKAEHGDVCLLSQC